MGDLNKTETALLLNIGEMIDLAIGTPEVGAVDFNMLQTVLHVLAQQMRVLDKKIELRGGAVAPVTPAPTTSNMQTLNITEYLVDTDQQASSKEKTTGAQAETPRTIKVVPSSLTEYKPAPKSDADKPQTLLVVERVKKTESQIMVSEIPARSQSAVATSTTGDNRLSLVTMGKFIHLESIVEDLKNKVNGAMPDNDKILHEVRSQTNVKSITDMWTSLNVSSRLAAAEAGLAKLGSLVQDIIKESPQLQNTIDASAMQAVIADGTTGQTAHFAGGANTGGSTSDDLTSLKQAVAKLRTDVDTLNGKVSQTAAGGQQEGQQASLPVADATKASAPTGQASSAPPGQAKKGPLGGGSAAAPARDSSGPDAVQAEMDTLAEPSSFAEMVQRLVEVEKKLEICCQISNKKSGVIQDQFTSFQDQLEGLARQMAALAEDTQKNKQTADLPNDLQALLELYKTVQEMQDQLHQVHDTAVQLAADKEDRQQHVNVLLEQIELLKTIKLDREDMAEAMADKADVQLLARKVSREQFQVACEDFSRGLGHALTKLSTQESLWQQALDDIQREIETKLDKLELSPLKELFDGKLRQLQERLRQLASLSREADAAGTKKRLLRNVNCISCDARAVMAMETEPTLPVSKPMPATMSMKPYLSYELDAIRKQQASAVPQRNLRDWETIDKQMHHNQPKQQPCSTRLSEKHVCNRYCGGSHTLTTPAQRVARLGHFLRQWGPDVVPLSSGMTTGDDGRIYKISPAEGDLTKGPDTRAKDKKDDTMNICQCADANAKG